jgi:hypothetical protein
LIITDARVHLREGSELVQRRSSDARAWLAAPAIAERATLSASGAGEPKRGHLLAVANQQDIADEHRVVPGFSLDCLEARRPAPAQQDELRHAIKRLFTRYVPSSARGQMAPEGHRP